MRRSIHGVVVEVAGSLPPELLEGLLGAFPEAPPAAPPDLTVQLEPASAPPPAGGRPLFFHGRLRAREADGAVLLTDGHSSARVAPGGGRIDLQVAPASLLDRHAFEQVLALVALVLGLRHRELFHLHAAALARGDGRAVLVAGGGGAGKSTLALALLEHGDLDYLGDDAALLSPRDGLTVHAFPRPFHLAERTARSFPRLAPLLGPPAGGEGKRPLDPRRAYPGRERSEARRPALLLLPEIAGRPRTVLEEVPAALAVGALLESSALLAVDGLPGARVNLELLGAAVANARCLRVWLGEDLLADPAQVVQALLDRVKA